MGPQTKPRACHPASLSREAALHGKADWAVAAAWTQEAALPARTGVGEGDGEKGGDWAYREPLSGWRKSQGPHPPPFLPVRNHNEAWFPQEETPDPGLGPLLSGKRLTWQNMHTQRRCAHTVSLFAYMFPIHTCCVTVHTLSSLVTFLEALL